MFSFASLTTGSLKSRCKPCDALRKYRRSERNALERESRQPAAAKFCSKCMRTQPTSSFSSDSGTKDGLHNACKTCHIMANTKLPRERKAHFGMNPPVAPPGEERVCGQCKETKPWNDFGRKRAPIYGIQSLCRECDKTYKARRRASARLRAPPPSSSA